MSMVDFVKKNRCVYEKMVKQAEMRNSTGPSEEFLTCEAQLNMARDRILCKALVMQEFQVRRGTLCACYEDQKCCQKKFPFMR